jgi:MoxR-like ATPase
MASSTTDFCFIGEGDTRQLEPLKVRIRPWDGKIGPWKPRRGESIADDDDKPPEHPSNYAASGDLADAVNTSIALGKPLLVTGNPGTGKSQLAERIAWELNLSPVLRFEAQSLSEASDLFYRYDLVGYLSAIEVLKAKGEEPPSPLRFLRLGPLGEAIIRSDPRAHATLFDAAFAPDENARSALARPSVVLIDEIDKASRDFPNDLLNGIERREFSIRELARELNTESFVANKDYPPIVIITSNSERDLPAPFLRRCTFFHIEDPQPPVLRDILMRKFFTSSFGGRRRTELPRFYGQLLEQFVDYQKKESLQYRPGTSELIDWTKALLRMNVDEDADLPNEIDRVKQTASTVAKHREDFKSLRDFIESLRPKPSAKTA